MPVCMYCAVLCCHFHTLSHTFTHFQACPCSQRCGLAACRAAATLSNTFAQQHAWRGWWGVSFSAVLSLSHTFTHFQACPCSQRCGLAACCTGATLSKGHFLEAAAGLRHVASHAGSGRRLDCNATGSGSMLAFQGLDQALQCARAAISREPNKAQQQRHTSPGDGGTHSSPGGPHSSSPPPPPPAGPGPTGSASVHSCFSHPSGPSCWVVRGGREAQLSSKDPAVGREPPRHVCRPPDQPAQAAEWA